MTALVLVISFLLFGLAVVAFIYSSVTSDPSKRLTFHVSFWGFIVLANVWSAAAWAVDQ